VFRAVAALAPARHTGYVGSLLTTPPSPKICRPRTEGAEYFREIVLPATVTEACSGGLATAFPEPATWEYAKMAASAMNTTQTGMDLFIVFSSMQRPGRESRHFTVIGTDAT
jgi:hypothetical protein